MTTREAKERHYWTVVQPMPAQILAMAAKQAEMAGVHGIFAPQVYGPPFVTLGAVAGVTERVKLASGIAIAAVRSPFETAMAAIDLDRISGGRFILGLGTSVHAWTSGVFGAPRYKPVTHLRETIAAIRHIIHGAHRHLDPFEGEYFRADFRELQPTQPPVREEIPIWVAALRVKLVELAGEVADGLIGHPMWSTQWALERMKPALESALSAAGRRRKEIEVNLWPWVAPNPDEMVRAFVAVGPPEKVREGIEPFWSFADSLCIVPPVYTLSPEKLLYYTQAIAETFYG